MMSFPSVSPGLFPGALLMLIFGLLFISLLFTGLVDLHKLKGLGPWGLRRCKRLQQDVGCVALNCSTINARTAWKNHHVEDSWCASYAAKNRASMQRFATNAATSMVFEFDCVDEEFTGRF